MTNAPTLKPLGAVDFLRTLEPDALRRAYGDRRFSAPNDAVVASELENHARLLGFLVYIPGSTLGRFRSTIGLVAHKSPRGVPTPPAPEPEPQSLPLEVQETSSEVAAVLEVLKDIRSELRQIKAGVFKLVEFQERQDSAATRAKTSGPVLVKEAAGGGQ